MRDKHSQGTGRWWNRRDEEWPDLSDRAFKILTAATLVFAVVIAVLILALYP
jgi:hypothetical protein